MKKQKNKTKNNEYKKLARNYKKSILKFKEDGFLINLDILPKTKGLNRIRHIINEIAENEDVYTNNKIITLFKNSAKYLDTEDILHSALVLYIMNINIITEDNLAEENDIYYMNSITLVMCTLTLYIMLFYYHNLDEMSINGVYSSKENIPVFYKEKGGIFLNPIFDMINTVCFIPKTRYDKLLKIATSCLSDTLDEIDLQSLIDDENDDKIDKIYRGIIDSMDKLCIFETNMYLSYLIHQLLRLDLKKIYVKNLADFINEDNDIITYLSNNNIKYYSIEEYNDIKFVLIFNDEELSVPIGIISLAGSKSKFNDFIIEHINNINGNVMENLKDIVNEETTL